MSHGTIASDIIRIIKGKCETTAILLSNFTDFSPKITAVLDKIGYA